ncbi:MAG: DUF3524 domain-containing protein [Nitrospirae bacterium]|nr:DUF3524 domain-containing protein [Nitrospirota bacterium]
MALGVLAVEPWHAGSHRDFLQGLCSRSRHRVTPVTLPGRFWKWRQTGSGMILARRALDLWRATRGATGPHAAPDLILASDFLNLPDFLALTRHQWPGVPAVLYMHENQLCYPLAEGHVLDPAYPQANLSSAAAADQVWFNSPHHHDAFFEGLERLLAACPDFPPRHLAADIRAKSRVLPLGVDLAGLRQAAKPDKSGPLAILWNHRWEHDKNPEEAFDALFRLDGAGADFRLLVAGQRFGAAPGVFAQAKKRLAHRIDHWGYLDDRAAYAALLARADVVISLAHHDFFGVGVVEAMAMGALPLLANRLNYPHLVPAPHHATCLVADAGALLERLAALCADPAATRATAAGPAGWVAGFDWAAMAPAFDQALDRAAHENGAHGAASGGRSGE